MFARLEGGPPMRSPACPLVLGLLLPATPGAPAGIRAHRGPSIRAAVAACRPAAHTLTTLTNPSAESGMLASHCGAARATRSAACGSNDTGISVGQPHGVRVDHIRATGNVSGFEIESSSYVRLDHNVATGNTCGI